MPSLKSVADKAQVSVRVAYQALSQTAPVDEPTRRLVLEAAAWLSYTLNVTIRDVADEAGVSIATVSHVINNSAPVKASTRKRVVDAVAALDYRPNVTAHNLKANETRLIGYGWHSFQLSGQINAVLDRFIYQVIQAAESSSYHILTFRQAGSNPTQAYEELIYTNRVDGFIISETNRNDERIQRLMELKFPFVAFGRANDAWDFPFVDVDGRRGMELAVEHLVAQGHVRIALLGWPEGSLSGDTRLHGYLDAMRKAGLTPLPGWIVRTVNDVGHSHRGAQQLMALPVRQRPTAIVCMTDLIAVGAMNFLENSGLKVGSDVAVTGFDDDPMSEFLRTPLTSVRQPIDLLASQVIDLLTAQIVPRSVETRQVLLAPDLIVRASSRMPLPKN